jgi:hypothetical protein
MSPDYVRYFGVQELKSVRTRVLRLDHAVVALVIDDLRARVIAHRRI